MAPQAERRADASELTERGKPEAAKAEAVRDLWEPELALESPGTSQTSEEARLATLMQDAPIPIISSPPERTWIWSDARSYSVVQW